MSFIWRSLLILIRKHVLVIIFEIINLIYRQLMRQSTIEEALQKLQKNRLKTSKLQQSNLSLSKDHQQDKIKQQKQTEKKIDTPINTNSVKQHHNEVNVLFYTNKIKSQPSGNYIDIIHKSWWGNYQLLEVHHSYIQWLFPNQFQSRFNSKSSPLLPTEVQKFRQNRQIGKRYLISYMMMLQFYGIKLKSKISGELMRSRNPRYIDRYRKTLLIAFHNHLRITRIMSSLVMVGYGRYAKQLSLFLKAQIYSDKGEMKALQRYGIYDRQWKQFSEYEEKAEDRNTYLVELDKKQK